MAEKVLIVDDDKDLIMLLNDELSERGYEVLSAADGRQGIELAKQQPDLIILGKH